MFKSLELIFTELAESDDNDIRDICASIRTSGLCKNVECEYCSFCNMENVKTTRNHLKNK